MLIPPARTKRSADEILNVDAVVKNLIREMQFEKIKGILDGGADFASFSFNRDIHA